MNPPRPGLGREPIVAAAIALIERDGLDAFSMRRLGAELGVDPMSVYHHVPNKAALFDAIVDWVWDLTTPEAPEAAEAWPAIATRIFGALREQLLAHPHLAPILGTRPVTTPHMLALTDRALGWLDAAGLPPASAMPLLDCLTAYTIGKVLAEVRGADAEGPALALASVTPDSHPHLVGALASGYGWEPDAQFERGMDALIAGWSG